MSRDKTTRRSKPGDDARFLRPLAEEGGPLFERIKKKLAPLPAPELKDLLLFGFQEAISNEQGRLQYKTMSASSRELMAKIFEMQLLSGFLKEGGERVESLTDYCLRLFQFKDEAERSRWQKDYEKLLQEPAAVGEGDYQKILKEAIRWARLKLKVEVEIEEAVTLQEILFLGIRNLEKFLQRVAFMTDEEKSGRYKEAIEQIHKAVAAFLAAYMPVTAAYRQEVTTHRTRKQ